MGGSPIQLSGPASGSGRLPFLRDSYQNSIEQPLFESCYGKFYDLFLALLCSLREHHYLVLGVMSHFINLKMNTSLEMIQKCLVLPSCSVLLLCCSRKIRHRLSHILVLITFQLPHNNSESWGYTLPGNCINYILVVLIIYTIHHNYAFAIVISFICKF